MITNAKHSSVNCLINRIWWKWSFSMGNKWIFWVETQKWYNRFVSFFFMCFAVAYQKWHFNGYFWKLNNQVHWNDTGLQIDCVIEVNLQFSEKEFFSGRSFSHLFILWLWMPFGQIGLISILNTAQEKSSEPKTHEATVIENVVT